MAQPPPHPTRETLGRSHTLSRPDRAVEHAPKPMVGAAATTDEQTSWRIFSKIVTFWAPASIMTRCGMKEKSVQQAWREKVSLVFIILIICALVVFFTLGLQNALCPSTARNPQRFRDFADFAGEFSGYVSIFGFAYQIAEQSPQIQEAIFGLENPNGRDITGELYSLTDDRSPFVRLRECNSLPEDSGVRQYQGLCDAENNCLQVPSDVGPDFLSPLPREDDPRTRLTSFEWEDMVKPVRGVRAVAMNGIALNFAGYLRQFPEPIQNDRIDSAIRLFTADNVTQNGLPARDMTRFFSADSELSAAVPCLTAKFRAGVVQKDSVNCFIADMVYYLALVVILLLIIIRFAMAIIFGWFMSRRISATPSVETLEKIKSGASGRNSGTPELGRGVDPTRLSTMEMNSVSGAVGARAKAPDNDDPRELYVVLLVTAYSEGEEGLRTTCDSLAATSYADHKKLIFVVADGYVKGDGNDKTTPEIVVDIMELDNTFGEDPEPQSYVAIASGKKQHNMAKNYIGHYNHGGRRVPMMCVAKCGTPAEKNDKKPGNRGKRDSQIVLMNLFSRVLFNERMTPQDADMFRKMHHLMGVTADRFELVLMVDADTMVYPDSLRLLVNAAQNDQSIMGLCGETKIANKRTSYITAIQVFEYHISHHLAKAFESVFGGVTCLPGCFCMYRIKVRKGPNNWVPILANRDIVDEYSSNVTETLHQKNLLLLGEDRFLTTLMLRTFPQRKMMFVPQAICKTVVPDSFKVLLSQRRRWINSTIHNLMELVLVRNLCGVFCCSMQFVIALELVGTVSLPVAIVLTVILIVKAPIDLAGKDSDEISAGDFVPIVLLVLILLLPALLILVTTMKVVYVGWMFAYLSGLFVWNFLLPTYAYWHFDDFSWGETRKVEGGGKDDHGGRDGEFDVNAVPLKRWEEWERMHRKREARKADETSPMGSSPPGLPSSTVMSPGVNTGHAVAPPSANGSAYLSPQPPPNQGPVAGYYSNGGQGSYGAVSPPPSGHVHGYPPAAPPQPYYQPQPQLSQGQQQGYGMVPVRHQQQPQQQGYGVPPPHAHHYQGYDVDSPYPPAQQPAQMSSDPPPAQPPAPPSHAQSPYGGGY